MSSTPENISSALRRLEARLLSVLFAFGVGRLTALSCGLVVTLYLLDRAFEPPREVRLMLAAAALCWLVWRLRQWLWKPLRSRPARRDLASMWERSHPQLGGLLSTSVELPEDREGISPELLQEVQRRAAQLEVELKPSTAAPGGRALRSALLGCLCLLGLSGAAWWQPLEAEIFFKRLRGQDLSWPRETTLVLLPPGVDGMVNNTNPTNQDYLLHGLGDDHWELQLATGTQVVLRVRADGVIPEQLVATVSGEARRMRKLGGGEFVLRLPPLKEELEIEFRGGDDQNGSPFLHLIPGNAPAIKDWLVEISPPAYTGILSSSSQQREFRVADKTAFAVGFKLGAGGKVELQRPDGSQEVLAADTDGIFSFKQMASGSGECVIKVTGLDGFANARAAVLSWQAQRDHNPEPGFAFPNTAWTTVPGGTIPLLLTASDDFGLVELRLDTFVPEQPGLLTFESGSKQWQGFLRISVPMPTAADNAEEAVRTRFLLSALDAAPPAGQMQQSRSPWIEVVPPLTLEERHLDRIIRVREKIEGVLSLADEISSRRNQPGAGRRMLRRMERIGFELESVLLERLYAQLDPASEQATALLDNLLSSSAPRTGDVSATLAETTPPGRSGMMFNLASAAIAIARGPANKTAELLATGEDATAAAAETAVQLRQMLNVLLEWEDFQSAINMLRDLLERQRSLHLRTQEASGD